MVNYIFALQYAFSVEEEGEVMISLMQEDTRKEKERGVENLTIGYFVMKVRSLCVRYHNSVFMRAWLTHMLQGLPVKVLTKICS